MRKSSALTSIKTPEEGKEKKRKERKKVSGSALRKDIR